MPVRNRQTLRPAISSGCGGSGAAQHHWIDLVLLGPLEGADEHVAIATDHPDGQLLNVQIVSRARAVAP